MQVDGGDPLDWTVDNVVDFLCRSPEAPWSRSSSQAPRPDPVSFEAALRENFITGEVLLHDVDKNTLRDDLGLRALGHRSCISMAIRYLQKRSQKFQESLSHSPLDDPTIGSSRRPSFSSPGIFRQPSLPAHFNPPSHSTTPKTHVQTTTNALTPSASMSVDTNPVTPQNPFSQPIGQVRGKQTVPPEKLPPGNEDRQADRRDQILGTPSTSHRTVENTPPPVNARRQEQIVVDAHGKKRRKLDLGSLPDVPGIRGSQHPGTQAKEWYMGPGQITNAQLFHSSDPGDSEDSFVVLGSGFPAQRTSVNKRLAYFYRQKRIKLKSSSDCVQWAIIPYKLSETKGQRLFTLYTAKDGKVSVTKEPIEKWPELRKLQEATAVADLHKSGSDPFLQSNEPQSHKYDILLQRYPPQEEDVLPPYGESGSEGEFDDKTWEEIDDERQDRVPEQEKDLTSAELEPLISQCISDYEDRWNQIARPRQEPKARKIWLKARRQGRVDLQIAAITRDIGFLEKRLGGIEREICKSQYGSESELKTQCQSLEQTIFGIQSQKWRIGVLQQEKCPPKVSAPPRPAPKKKPKNADEESLHSETDESSDSLDDFIDKSDLDSRAGPFLETPASPARSVSSPSETDSEGGIISPSGIRRRTSMHRVFATSSSPSSPERISSRDSQSPPAASQPAGDLIDLTVDSAEEDLEIETPPLNPVQHKVSKTAGNNVKAERAPSVSPPPDLGPTVASKAARKTSSRVQVVIPQLKKPRNGTEAETPLPDLSDLGAILDIPWSKLEERRDRRRLLAKIIGSLADDFRLAMTDEVPKYGVTLMQEYVDTALEILCQSQDTFPGVDEKQSQFIMRTASFYISWVNCAQLHKGIRRHYILESIDELKDSFAEFYNQLCNRLEAYRNWVRPQRKSKALGDVARSSQKPSDSSEGELAESAHTPHKKRKREVKESLTAKNTQASAKRRVAVQHEQREKLKRKMGNMGISNDDPAHQVVSFDDPVLYLDPHIGQVVKPHQLEGIQFMWRELIRDETQQGCLLAHTMGLGKTMQVIALLVTIAAAASSNDPKVRQQVPEAFHRPQTLIICPSSLIENWYEEIILWAPQDSGIGLTRKVTSASPPRERIQLISEWDQEGGILIISYNMFHAWIFNKETKKRPPPLTEEDHENVKKWLLEGPNLIVADEAHMMKNRATAASRAAMQFRSKSRIALTGSPLANNLVDYFTMVDWIAKGYLGEFVEFKANFVEPIEQGLYLDSSRHERRRSLVKLKVLQGILNPKINRADITVLADNLPPKVEFVLTVPLTKVQTDAYNLYVDTILQGKGDIGNAKLWSWLAILSLCCNHPACFRDKLLNRASEARKIDQKLREVEELPGDEPIGQAGLPDSEKLVIEQEKLFASIPDMMAVGLSYRAQILDRIIEESVRVNDKVLVFSHSLLTLDYIEHVLTLRNRKYCRLDGNTPVQSRQMATKNFNTGVDQHVYLISTRAGGLGLNIPGANRVIIFDFAFNPVWEQQSVGRAYRLGQKKPVFVYRFISGGTFEEIVYNNVVFKTQLAFRVVDKKNPIRQASKSPGDYLFPVKQVPQEDISEFIGKDPDVLDKILLEQNDEERSIRKIALTETFRREDDERLTEEETKGVQEELDDERLKRTNPEEYARRISERQRRLMAEGPTPILAAQTHPGLFQPPNRPAHAPPPFPSQQSLTIPSSSVPTHAHNVGPPALTPDTSVFKNRPAWSSPAAGLTSFPSPRNEHAAYSSGSPGASNTGTPRSLQQPPNQGGSPSTQAPRTGPHGPSPLQQPPGLPPQTLGGQTDGADGSGSQSPESDEEEQRDYWTSPSCKTQ
ncbi:hypothetical protein P168DRAFT_303257 [Aspergillus campestris IBT 28561]|uniref:SNF2 family helicase/ATPase n=1 Tax=Aspergillus campestris (strain IBT 28561) TaxID=1392248 RepID=A0A2I1D6F9_ASPC2|nr:uncharacterized protein P168DRAFT_303257 [Aspergillus campestris IBT 28561]PKY05457.1 hypothetical protein P168DRAFT_303257 [Aspergillus campestris IBT 28561]